MSRAVGFYAGSFAIFLASAIGGAVGVLMLLGGFSAGPTLQFPFFMLSALALSLTGVVRVINALWNRAHPDLVE